MLGDITIRRELSDAGNENRLVLRFIEVDAANLKPGSIAYDFHSLLWYVRNGDSWTICADISREDFERGHARRWISKLHTFNPTAGTAILQIAEEQPPDAQGTLHYEYAWREWDLVNNKQVRVLRVCNSPNDPFEE